MRRLLVERELTSEGPVPRKPRPGHRGVKVNLAESPRTWLHARGYLNDRHFLAGERLHADWKTAQIMPHMTMRWDSVRIKGGGGRGLEPGERQIAARQRFD